MPICILEMCYTKKKTDEVKCKKPVWNPYLKYTKSSSLILVIFNFYILPIGRLLLKLHNAFTFSTKMVQIA